MSWQSISAFNIPVGRSDAILIPVPLTASSCAVRVTDIKRRTWRKAGDLYQQFADGVRSPSMFVPFTDQISFDMQTGLGAYHLRFQPISYHQGLFVEVWQWLNPTVKAKPVNSVSDGLVWSPTLLI